MALALIRARVLISLGGLDKVLQSSTLIQVFWFAYWHLPTRRHLASMIWDVLGFGHEMASKEEENLASKQEENH